MARTRKSIQPLNLYKYDVLIEDRGVRSDYFKLSQFDGYFYGGRNAFLVEGATVLKPNSKILVEILNKDGNTVYSAPIQGFIEGNSRLIQVEIYSDTPPGGGKLVLLGSADTYLDGREIPSEWKDKYNVRWISDVIISPLVENKTSIRFINSPSITVNEKFYATPSSSVFTENVSLPVSLNFTPKYYNVYPNGYTLKMSGSSTRSLNESYLGGVITGSIMFTYDSTVDQANIRIPISKIYNNNLADSTGTLIYSNKNQLIIEGSLPASGSGSITIDKIGKISTSGSINIYYNRLETLNTGSVISFAKLRLVNLKTYSGEINKVRLSYKPETEPGEYILLGDIQTNVQELLSVDSGSGIVNAGKFSDNSIVSKYWYAETMSLQKTQQVTSLPSYYFSASVAPGSLSIINTSINILNGIQARMPINAGVFFNTASYFIGTTPSSSFQLFPNSEYTLSFKALVSKYSASVILNQPDYTLEVYLIKDEKTTTKLISSDLRGQLLGSLSPSTSFEIQNFETIEFNFFPQILETGNFSLRFIVYGGFWNIADVSIKTAQEPFFSPDEIDILIPNVNYNDKILSFKAEYLDVNNNSTSTVTFSTPTYFTGSLNTINTKSFIVKPTGQIRLIPLSNNPSNAENGDLYYNSTTNKFRGYAGGVWVDLH